MTMSPGLPVGGAHQGIPGLEPPGRLTGKVPLLTAKPRGGSGAAPSRMHLDSNLRRWFSRNLGLWRSRRLYFFPDDEVLAGGHDASGGEFQRAHRGRGGLPLHLVA